MEEEQLKDLIQRFADDNASEAEICEMLTSMRNDRGEAALEIVVQQLYDEAKSNNYPQQVAWETVWNNITHKTQPAQVIRFPWFKIAAAAVLILCISLIGYFSYHRSQEKQIARSETIINDIAPGKVGAVLTLGNGQTIILDTAKNGAILGNFAKTDESITVESEVVEYATLTTPKARTQQLTLSDGSKVWLNAVSSISFPTMFEGSNRVVEVTGEVYFEIAQNAKMPFRVIVNAYTDEVMTKTTLLEGSIKISTSLSQAIMKPGQQAQLKSGEIDVTLVDVDQTVAWKNGFFSFNNADLPTVMRQIARWYDVEIDYVGNVPQMKFGGKIDRNSNASQVLKILEESNVHFEIKGKKIIVMP